METQPQVQPTAPVFSPLSVAATEAAPKKEDERSRNDKKDESSQVEREIYDNVACTD